MPTDAPDWYSVDLFKQTYLSQVKVITTGATLASAEQPTILSVTGSGELLHFILVSNHPGLNIVARVEGVAESQWFHKLPSLAAGGGYNDLQAFTLRPFNGDTGLWKLLRYDETNDLYMIALAKVVPFYQSLELRLGSTADNTKADWKIIYRTYT